jgi:iron complex transport system ATP-binding protein
MLISTHDLDLALRNADCVWLLGHDRTFCSGAPEDLVLSGELAAAFTDENIRFDPLRGVLQAREKNGAQVALAGEHSVYREWTLRALERCGYRLWSEASEPPAECPRIEVLGDAGWNLHIASTTQSFDTLQDLTRALTALEGAQAAT